MGIFRSIGASNHVPEEREVNDYYATEPKAVRDLLQREAFNPHILEPACGEGHISKELGACGYEVYSCDLIDRGYGEVANFLERTSTFWGDIVTNPPYSLAQEFIERAILLVPEGNKVAMLLKIQFLESAKRQKLFKAHPPKRIYVSAGRTKCAKNGDFNIGASAQCYAWFIWEKGFKGHPEIRWFNTGESLRDSIF